MRGRWELLMRPGMYLFRWTWRSLEYAYGVETALVEMQTGNRLWKKLLVFYRQAKRNVRRELEAYQRSNQGRVAEAIREALPQIPVYVSPEAAIGVSPEEAYAYLYTNSDGFHFSPEQHPHTAEVLRWADRHFQFLRKLEGKED